MLHTSSPGHPVTDVHAGSSIWTNGFLDWSQSSVFCAVVSLLLGTFSDSVFFRVYFVLEHVFYHALVYQVLILVGFCCRTKIAISNP